MHIRRISISYSQGFDFQQTKLMIKTIIFASFMFWKYRNNIFFLFFIGCVYYSIMSQREGQESLRQPEKKNQKNIYVHKINSLMKISRENLQEDEKQISTALNKKKIKKVHSEIDKNALKLEKNRESAKRARLRKKLYIKLLEGQVDRLKEVAKEGERIEVEAKGLLKVLSRKQESCEAPDDVEKYLSRENLTDLRKYDERENSTARLDKLAEQICQLSMCGPLRNIRQLSSQISLEEILKSQCPDMRKQQGDQLQQIIKQVLLQGEELRNLYSQIVKENQKVKQEMIDVELKQEEFLDDFSQPDDSSQLALFQEFATYLPNPSEPSTIFINLNDAEKILIQAHSFLELNCAQEQPK